MIKVGYVKTDNTDVAHENCNNTMEANDSLFALQESKANDSSINYFYLALYKAAYKRSDLWRHS